ncbi:N-acetylmuramoyl-L-alanine amidase [Rhodococcus marinonascens]|uniref:N-acetylmuramoyl-L-alanine amidase n=1 Tax=Rhodococcus marinonascens TaxID=38311 RepID=UPI000934EBAA|nr:N-acetylmuramoyl-L-alanine amidase [Rhodococcus marinonascens]
MQEINQLGISPNHSSRHGSRVRLFVLHTQEGGGTAQSLAGYLQRASSGVSYHYSIDDHTCIDVVDTDRASWSVLDANGYSINLCFAGSRASQSRQVWIESYGKAIDYAAKLFVQDAKKYGFDARTIGWDELGLGYSGGTDHMGVTKGLGIGNHTDCGPNFPWDIYRAAITKHVLGETAPVPAPAPEVITVSANLLEAYRELGGEDGPLGRPVADHTVLTTPDGQPWGEVQGFERGALYRRHGQPGHAIWGQIRERWNRAGFENGTFGWPTSNEYPAEDGIGRIQDFEHGRIVWYPDGTVGLQPTDGPDTLVPDLH